MSSLRAMAKKGNVVALNIASRRDAYVDTFLKASRDPDVIGVRASSVAADVVLETKDGGWLIPDSRLKALPTPATPPHRRMWIEFTLGEDRMAVLVERVDGEVNPLLRAKAHVVRAGLEDRWSVVLIPALPMDGCLVPIPIVSVDYLGEDGLLNALVDCSDDLPDDGDGGVLRYLSSQSCKAGFVAYQSLARLNCRNVELRMAKEFKLRPQCRRRDIPACVWHEIVVTSVPKIRTSGCDAFSVADDQKRAYWIRGHYADYRKGAGLFGNPKLRCVFWIPEYRRGNEELGQVIPEYTLQ